MRAARRAACVRFVRTHVVLVVSAVAALLTMIAVPPDAAYMGYFDLKTLACLFGILAWWAPCARVFEATARAMVARFSTCRAAVSALVAVTLVLSMVATNDMALIMMLPLSAATLLKAGWERALPFVFIMQSLAANLGGMIVPFGNPQNLYLFERFSVPLGDFLATMALPFAVSVLLIGVCCALFAQPTPRMASEELPASERTVRIPRARTTAYVLLLALVIASVFRLVPYPVALGTVVVGLLLLDRRALRSVDVGLLLTFACFFVFAGNMARIPAVEDTLSQVMAHHALLASAGASQVISNVPAAVLLSHFTDSYPALLVGVNIGGAGTLVASLASSSRSISTGPCAPRSDAAPASRSKLRAGSLRASPRSTASFSWCCTRFAARRDSTPSL
ncbi:SLC13 family permease [Eggerthella sinensis]|uniref:SLC13 family permease n=1 Tax=Eggerthella sinensis TaxID=242230 RepID=UPI0022E21349|nr:SLC13 family permease [Eggerthella sinensis]